MHTERSSVLGRPGARAPAVSASQRLASSRTRDRCPPATAQKSACQRGPRLGDWAPREPRSHPSPAGSAPSGARAPARPPRLRPAWPPPRSSQPGGCGASTSRGQAGVAPRGRAGPDRRFPAALAARAPPRDPGSTNRGRRRGLGGHAQKRRGTALGWRRVFASRLIRSPPPSPQGSGRSCAGRARLPVRATP